jgi:hypothetical protein
MSPALTEAVLVQAVVIPSLSLLLMLSFRFGGLALRWACRRRKADLVQPTISIGEDESIVASLREATRAADTIRGRVSFLSTFFITQGMGAIFFPELTFQLRDFLGFEPLSADEAEEAFFGYAWLSVGGLRWWEDGTVLMVLGPWLVATGALAMRPTDMATARRASNWFFLFCSPIPISFILFLVSVDEETRASVALQRQQPSPALDGASPRLVSPRLALVAHKIMPYALTRS